MVIPDENKENPSLIRAVHTALEHAIITSDTPTQRAAISGNSYRLSPLFDITTTQSSAYLYVTNPTSNYFLLSEDTISIKGGNAKTFVYHDADVDVGTFTEQSFSNSRTGDTSSPDQNAYFGYDNDVTINDTGEIFEQDFVVASSGSTGSTSTGSGISSSVDFVIDPNGSAMLEIRNDSTDTITASVSAEFHELRTNLPDTTQ